MGTYPYGGAIIMAALAAVKSGAGLVTVGTDRENIPALHNHLPEAMAFSLQDQQLLKEQLEKEEVVLLGPGLRDNAFGEDIVKQVFASLSQIRFDCRWWCPDYSCRNKIVISV